MAAMTFVTLPGQTNITRPRAKRRLRNMLHGTDLSDHHPGGNCRRYGNLMLRPNYVHRDPAL